MEALALGYILSDPYTQLTAPRQAMIEEFDLDGDGEINEKEFMSIMLDGE